MPDAQPPACADNQARTAYILHPGVALTAANITAAGNITATSLLGYNITVSALP